MNEWNHKYAVCNYCCNAILVDDREALCLKKDKILEGKEITYGRSCKKFAFCSVSTLSCEEYKPYKKKTEDKNQLKLNLEKEQI